MDDVFVIFVSSFQIPCTVYPSSLAPHGFCFGWRIPSEDFVFEADGSFSVTTDFTNHTERECGHWRHDFAEWFREYADECMSA